MKKNGLLLLCAPGFTTRSRIIYIYIYRRRPQALERYDFDIFFVFFFQKKIDDKMFKAQTRKKSSEPVDVK